MKKKHRISSSPVRRFRDENQVIAGCFNDLGFDSLKQILDMRIFDLMNMNTLHAVRVEEIITCLYKNLNPNNAVDEAMYYGFMDQYFDYTSWRKIHRSLEKITVRELVMTEDINLKAIRHFYDSIRRKFFGSKEYDRREYRYADYKDYLKSRNQSAEGVCGR